ncbi:hypothetical protein PILCRDRAFT_775973 [Piloderma croceum F 1598]|uniref:Uncharacterized protein n=1 Tax=Piloderma croceum (strain F 1598) TaxID=765440 RepID=A0A0C3BHZ9_PILCF|nr:hypothetical protein PILCRDRAFT_775973 [Piloderma croceum F 1598]
MTRSQAWQTTANSIIYSQYIRNTNSLRTEVLNLQLTACEANPLVHLQPSTSNLAVKHRFIEVDESQYLCEELNSRKAQIHLAEQRHNEKLCQAQEAQRQEIASLQTHVSEQNTLVEARYAEQLQQSKHAFQQELLQKEQVMQRELLLGMQQKEEAMWRELELELTKAQAQREQEMAVLERKFRALKNQPQQAHPPTDQVPQPSGSATTEMTSMSVQNTGRASAQNVCHLTGDPKSASNPSGRISQSINSLRCKHPGISGQTVLTADTAQDDLPKVKLPSNLKRGIAHKQPEREQSDTDGAYDPDSDDSDNELVNRLEPVIMKAFQRFVKNGGDFQTNTTARTRRRKPRLDRELRKEKDNELPSDRSAFLAHGRALMKQVFGTNKDEDFALHQSVTPQIADAYSKGEEEGPDENDLHIDMMGRLDSEWNKKVLEILLAKLKDVRKEGEWSLPNRSDDYLAALIKDRMKRAMRAWAASQRKTNQSGELETWDDVEQRLVAQKEAQLVTNRHATRRRNRYNRRKRIVEYMIELRAGDENQDLHLWKWLQSVLEHLGADGMSSDESSTENFKTVYRVTNMPWRRALTESMDIVDRQRHKDADIFTPKGSKPAKRL